MALNKIMEPKQGGQEFNFKVTALVVVLILVFVGFVWSFSSYQKAKEQISYLSAQLEEEKMSEEEVGQLLAQVGELIILPEDQGEPMVATIKDVEKLKEAEPFYTNALNDDKLLLYKDKAIIYSPSRNKIVNVGPVYLDSSQVQQEVISIDIRNGSETPGLASEKAEELGQMKEFEVVDIKNANSQDYNDLVIVNLTGKNVSNLENLLGTKAIVDLPEGELNSEADVILIIGN